MVTNLIFLSFFDRFELFQIITVILSYPLCFLFKYMVSMAEKVVSVTESFVRRTGLHKLSRWQSFLQAVSTVKELLVILYTSSPISVLHPALCTFKGGYFIVSILISIAVLKKSSLLGKNAHPLLLPFFVKLPQSLMILSLQQVLLLL